MEIDKKYALLDTDFLYKAHLARNTANHTLAEVVLNFDDYEFFCHEMIKEELTRHEIYHITRRLPILVHYSCSKYLAVHVLVFGASIVVQLLLIWARTGNVAEEQHIFQKRWKRDENVFQTK